MISFKKFFILFFIIFLSCERNKIIDNNLYLKELNDKENNDNFNNAISVSAQTSIIGFFNKKENESDKDYYKVFFPDLNISYKIILTSVCGIDSKFSIYNMKFQKIFTVDNNGIGESEKLWDFTPLENYYYFFIEAKVDYNEVIPYRLNFIKNQEKKDIEYYDEIEPNNDKENANNITPYTKILSYISPADDSDYFFISKNEISDFNIICDSKSNLDLNFLIIDRKNNIEKFINGSSFGIKEVFNFLSLDKGEYFLKISGIQENDRNSPLYYLILDKIQENIINEREFNDNFNLATEINMENEIIGNFYPEKDKDFFKFNVNNDTNNCIISLSNVAGIDSILKIYDNNKNLINFIDKNKIDFGEEISLNNIPKGTYYILLESEKKSLINYRLYFNIIY